MPNSKEKRTKWKIRKLKEHPKQAALFGDLPDEELHALAADMKRRGQQDPVVILPNGVIIAGHQRVAAAKLLGWKEIEVIVRYDLNGDTAAETELITDNLYRRQLSPLARARCMKRLMELESRTGTLGRGKMEELKAKIGKLFSRSAKSVSRSLLLLGAPVAIQQAVERGEISMVNACKVAVLDKRQQQEIARRITASEKAKAVVAEYLSKPNAQSGKAYRCVSQLAQALKRAEQQLDGRMDELRPDHVEPHLGTLDKGMQLLDTLKRRGTSNRQRPSKDLRWIAGDEEE